MEDYYEFVMRAAGGRRTRWVGFAGIITSRFIYPRKKLNRQNWGRFRPFCGAAIWILSQDWQLYGETNSLCDSHSQFRHFAPQVLRTGGDIEQTGRGACLALPARPAGGAILTDQAPGCL